MLPAQFADCHPLADAFRAMIQAEDFPCVGAKAALRRDGMRFLVARDIRSSWNDLGVMAGLREFVASYRSDPTLFRSLVLLFETNDDIGEQAFETHMWQRLQSLTDKDGWLGEAHDPRVSDDPADPHFSLSFAGEAFFVVGLHPNASRPARRFVAPALVFNLHDQFEQLRSDGRYEKMRGAIISRDVALAGSPNPMLARHGASSEARQYSGREVGNDWTCPFVGRSAGVAADAA